MQRKVNSTLVKGNGCNPFGDSCLIYQKKEEGRVKSQEKKFLSGQQGECSERSQNQFLYPWIPSLPDLRGRMNGTFYHEAMGVSEWEESILRYGVVLVAK